MSTPWALPFPRISLCKTPPSPELLSYLSSPVPPTLSLFCFPYTSFFSSLGSLVSLHLLPHISVPSSLHSLPATIPGYLPKLSFITAFHFPVLLFVEPPLPSQKKPGRYLSSSLPSHSCFRPRAQLSAPRGVTRTEPKSPTSAELALLPDRLPAC